jgi:hypothetical protein
MQIMSNESSMTDRIAENVGSDPVLVGRIIEEFCLELRKGLDGYKGMNGDYLGEKLHWEIGARAFFHLLGFLDEFSGKYQWEPGTAPEYILRLYSENDWKPFSQEYMTPKSDTDSNASSKSSELIEQFCSTASSCAMTLMSNAAYVQKELANVVLPDASRSQIEKLCSDWIGTKHDVIHELGELSEAPEISNRIRRIMSWLSEDVVNLRIQVERLEGLAQSDPRYRLAYLLVGESGGNILKSFVAAGEAADRLLAELS